MVKKVSGRSGVASLAAMGLLVAGTLASISVRSCAWVDAPINYPEALADARIGDADDQEDFVRELLEDGSADEIVLVLSSITEQDQWFADYLHRFLIDHRPEVALRALLVYEGPLKSQAHRVKANLYRGSEDRQTDVATSLSMNGLLHSFPRAEELLVDLCMNIGPHLAAHGFPNDEPWGIVFSRPGARRLLVGYVCPGMPAFQLGLESGDQIISLDGEIRSPRRAIHSFLVEDNLEVVVRRHSAQVALTLTR